MAHYTRHQLSTTADGQPRLRHGRNRHREVPLQHGPAQTIHVSGYDASTHTVWEFYGCLLPWCLTCYPRRLKTHRQTQPGTLHDLWVQTQARWRQLWKTDYQLVIQWECHWQRHKSLKQGPTQPKSSSWPSLYPPKNSQKRKPWSPNHLWQWFPH